MAAHTNVCVIGLGSMGMGAARACLQAGLNTWGVDINPDNCRALLAAGAKGAGPSAVPFAAELDAVVLLVVNAAQVRGILFGESGLAAHLKPGTVVMVSSTIASADAQAIAEALAEYQLLMLDAPVSGGAVKAAAGDMTVMASGSDAAFARLARCWTPWRQSLPHRERHWSWIDGKNYPSAAGRGAHRRCRRSDGACRPRRDPTGNDV